MATHALTTPLRNWTTVATPVGPLTLRSRDGHLVALRFGARPGSGAPAGAELRAAAAQLDEYFAGQRHEFDLPLELPSDGLVRPVLRAVARIPYGERLSYGELTARLGLPPDRPRDVGFALARNPLPIVIPCHRVVGADGGLTGYRGGLERKAALLALEGGQLRLEL